jgi:hypothetical protein
METVFRFTALARKTRSSSPAPAVATQALRQRREQRNNQTDRRKGPSARTGAKLSFLILRYLVVDWISRERQAPQSGS